MTATGGCACDSVRYEVTGPLRPVIACHCEQCRRTSGHFVAATAVKRNHLRMINDTCLRWFTAIEGYRRGFCQTCGSSLFFEALDEDRISIAAGSLDGGHEPLEIAAHIFAAEKGNYYEIAEPDGSVFHEGDHSVSMPD